MVFCRVLQWTIWAIRNLGLLICILENVVGIATAIDGRMPVAEYWIKHLRKIAPEFDWCTETLKLADYLTPHIRVRLFIKGVRRVALVMLLLRTSATLR